MTTHFLLDFTAPFGVGDEVYTTYPTGDGKYAGRPKSYPSVRGKIASIKLVFELDPGNSCAVKHPAAEKLVHVEEVCYTILPLEPTQLSAFTVTCSTQDGKSPKLFATESQLVAYQAEFH